MAKIGGEGAITTLLKLGRVHKGKPLIPPNFGPAAVLCASCGTQGAVVLTIGQADAILIPKGWSRNSDKFICPACVEAEVERILRARNEEVSGGTVEQGPEDELLGGNMGGATAPESSGTHQDGYPTVSFVAPQETGQTHPA